MNNMFEVATRQKLRFNYKGSQSIEDLWDMPLLALDELYKELNAELKDKSGESLLGDSSSKNITLELKIGTIKYVVETKLKEQKSREDLVANKARKQKLLGIIANKQDTELEGKTVKQLNKMIDDLD